MWEWGCDVGMGVMEVWVLWRCVCDVGMGVGV